MRPVIAIVGAGFSGVAVAARLLCQRETSALDIVLINASGKRARGVAYGTESRSHVLNVPAGRMSLWAEKPDDFLRFLQISASTNDAPVSGHDFVPRSRYGDYLEHTLAVAQQHSPHTLQHRVGKVVDVVAHENQSFTLVFADGSTLLADKLVLALGNFQPQNPRLRLLSEAEEAAAFAHAAYLRDPWSAASNKALQALPKNARVLLLGTGLSMLDVVMLLETSAHKSVKIDAISRRGLLPQAHRVALPGAHFTLHEELIPPALRAYAVASIPARTAAIKVNATALGLLRALRASIAAHAPNDWRDIIAAIRPITPALWCALPEAEQQRFIQHLAPYWDTHRHRAAPVPAQALKEAIASGRVSTKAARIIALKGVGIGIGVRGEALSRLLVSTQPRGSALIQTQTYDLVVNCTGPQNSLLHLNDTLIDSLLKQGLAQKLDNGTGFKVTQDLRLAAAGLYYVGPLLRANLWEATAVPELREHARTVAEAIARANSQANV